MTTSAPTNQPGTYFYSEFRSDRVHGRIGNYHFDDPYTYSVQTAKSGKSAVVYGNRKTSNPYFREIRLLTKDVPSKRRHLTYYEGRPYEDYAVERHLSRDFPTMFLLPPASFLEDLANARSASITKARAALAGESNVQNGADLAEGRETVQMIAKTTRQVLLALRAARQGNWPAVANHLGVSKRDLRSRTTWSDGWLQYQYGWKPLLGSIHDNYNRFRSLVPSPMFIEAEKSGGKVTFDHTSTSGEYTTRWKLEGGAKTGIKARLDNAFLREGDQWGLVNPFSVLWEVVPFSFVFDWFIPVGAMLSSLSATSGLTFLDGYTSQRWAGTFSVTRNGWDNPGLLEVSHFRLDREVLPGFPMPQVYGKTNPFSSAHIANALALIYSTRAL